MELFKTLVNNDPDVIKYLGRYIKIIDSNYFGNSLTPTLQPMTATLEDMTELYPNLDFGGLKLITVRVEDLISE